MTVKPSVVTTIDTLRARALMYRRIREFFAGLDYLEVDTPLLSAATNTDVHIQSISAAVNGQTRYLQTSPEFYMKRLLASGSGSIFQIGHAFRDGEQGARHQPEFTLLEWYSVGFDYHALMDQVEALIQSLHADQAVFQRLSYQQAFRSVLELDVATASLTRCRACVTSHVDGIDADSLERDDCLDLLLSTPISKQFKGYTFVYDYPATQASLARLRADNERVAERFELFWNDLELANGFSELTDAAQQRQRFEQDNRLRQALGLEPYPVDEALLRALQQGMPDCAGVAIGLERLMMALQGLSSIDHTHPLLD